MRGMALAAVIAGGEAMAHRVTRALLEVQRAIIDICTSNIWGDYILVSTSVVCVCG